MLTIKKSPYTNYMYGGAVALVMLVAVGAVTFATQLQSPSGSQPFAGSRDSISDTPRGTLAVHQKDDDASRDLPVTNARSDKSSNDGASAATASPQPSAPTSPQMTRSPSQGAADSPTLNQSAPAVPTQSAPPQSTNTPSEPSSTSSDKGEADSPSLLGGVLTPVVTIVDALL